MYTILADGGKFFRFSLPSKAFVYYKRFRLDLLRGQKSPFSLGRLQQYFEKMKFKRDFPYPIVIHFFYELGHFFVGNEDRVGEDDVLAIEIHYQRFTPHVFADGLRAGGGRFSMEKLSSVSFEDYQKKFARGYESLIQGQCYQFNLTIPYRFSLPRKATPEGLMARLWKNPQDVGAYAHGTYIPQWKTLYLSNSPECLFHIKRRKRRFSLYSMPIKGSLSLADSPSQEDVLWETLKSCPKNGAELSMITDLLRNDLSKIEWPRARVLAAKRPLKVPGLLHQFSLVHVDLSYQVGVGRIIRALFPGGSVTGAPKKRAMELLQSLEGGGEKEKRKFYCGSTLILFKSLAAASINIRSAEVDFSPKDRKVMTYGAGGGVTLLSQAREEFSEIEMKLNSFIYILLVF